jgi:hypothetical protein
VNVLTQRLRLAADYLGEHGWAQGAELDDGRACLTGAIRYCAPQTGDEYVIRAVLRSRGTAESWNDTETRTEADVAGLLRTAEITDAALAGTFGPQWREIVTLVRQVSSLTPGQADMLSSEWDAIRGAARGAVLDAARGAAWDAARDAAWYAAWDAARDAAWDAVRGTVRYAVWGSARDAARALAVRDLVSSEHFAVLYGPWASVFGKPAPCEL